MLNQSFRHVIVPKAGTTLLADGATVEDLVEGQLGFLDAKTYLAEATPTYANQKAVLFVQGTPDNSHLPLMAGFPKTNQYTKLIKGKLLKKYRVKTANAGQVRKIAIGYDGVDTTKSLRAKVGDVRKFFIKASGNPIDKLYGNTGFQRQYWIEFPCSLAECDADACEDVAPGLIADQLKAKIEADPKWSNGSGQMIKVTKVTGTDGDGNAVAGVILESAFVNRVTNDCLYDSFPLEVDNIHLEVSEMNHDYNGNPCQSFAPVTETQALIYPQGLGVQVREQEIKSQRYFLMERSHDPAVRDAEGFTLFSDPTLLYDEVTFEFDFKYKVLGWSQEYTDSYHVVIYVVNGSALATAVKALMAAYATSVGNTVEQEID